MQDESGFTLIELLVVILILGILASIAISALTLQRSKAFDASAKTMAQTAQTAMETFATENGGSYLGGTPAKLHEVEPAINVGANKTEPELVSTTTSALEYTLTVEANNTNDKYTVTRESTGAVKHSCVSPGTKRGCPGQSSSANSW